jgi:hypothetical protein
VPRWHIFGLVALDLGAAAWLQPTEFTRRGKLVEQSPVLSHLATYAKGERVRDAHQNLSMIAGTAPIDSYRTVDISFVTQYYNPDPLADRMSWQHRTSDRTDLRWEVWNIDPALLASWPPRAGERDEQFVDALLAETRFGRKFVNAFGRPATTFVVRQRNPNLTSRAWYWNAENEPDRFERLLERHALRGKKLSDLTYHWLYLPPLEPVPSVRTDPERMQIEVSSMGPGMLIVSELAYPGWEATINWPDGRSVPAQTLVTEAGCLLVRITMLGEYRVELSYRSRPFEIGLAISSVGVAVWVAAIFFASAGRRSDRSSGQARPNT